MWHSYDPDLHKVDIHGNRPLKPHELAIRDIGALAFERVLAGMKEAREASPRAHVIAWRMAQRSPADGRSPVCWRHESLEAEEQRRREAPARRAALFAELASIGKDWRAMERKAA